MSQPTYPHVTARLTDSDGNVFAIVQRVSSALKAAGEQPAAEAWREDAMASGSYDEVLQKAMALVTVT